LLTSLALTASMLFGAVSSSASAATAAPAEIPSQPEVSTSYYIQAPPTASVLNELAAYGIDQGNQDCEVNQGQPQGTITLASSVFLDFGAQDVDGQETWSTAGVIGNPNTPQYTNSWIAQAVENFAEGYDIAASSCDVNFNGESIFSDVYYGTSNSGDTPTAAQVTAQADNWFNMGVDIANAVTADVENNAGTELNDAQVGPANDIEPGFSEPPSTVEAWAQEVGTDEINAVNNSTLPVGLLPFASNYGSADGCPTSGLTASSPCNNNWTIGDLDTIMGNYGEAAFPQIYTSGQAPQWAAFCSYYDSDWGLSPLWGFGILTAPDVPGFLSASDAWNDLNNDLSATGNSDCETEPPAYETTMETDITS
jgi:hypothetical protein